MRLARHGSCAVLRGRRRLAVSASAARPTTMTQTSSRRASLQVRRPPVAEADRSRVIWHDALFCQSRPFRYVWGNRRRIAVDLGQPPRSETTASSPAPVPDDRASLVTENWANRAGPSRRRRRSPARKVSQLIASPTAGRSSTSAATERRLAANTAVIHGDHHAVVNRAAAAADLMTDLRW